jgi:hypothetical protein
VKKKRKKDFAFIKILLGDVLFYLLQDKPHNAKLIELVKAILKELNNEK